MQISVFSEAQEPRWVWVGIASNLFCSQEKLLLGNLGGWGSQSFSHCRTLSSVKWTPMMMSLTKPKPSNCHPPKAPKLPL